LGTPELFPFIYARAAFISLAAEAGIRVPQTEAIHSRQQLDQWISRNGVPAVLKANGTSGGDGVKVVHSAEEAQHAFRKLQAPPLFARAIKRALIDQDTTLLAPSLLRRSHRVNAQAFIAGREATSAFACWQGKVLASVHVEVINKMHAAGHATVVRRIDNPEMQSAAEKIARRLNLSGLHGLDFMIESHSGNAYLIEMNPRATQIGHLNLGTGRNLPAAITAALTGRPADADGPITENDLIALFPQECLRDPASPFLESAYHDVPWSEPALIQHALGKLRTPRVLLSDRNWGRVPRPHSPQKYIAPTLDCKTD
jgi:biotin carboxylase